MGKIRDALDALDKRIKVLEKAAKPAEKKAPVKKKK